MTSRGPAYIDGSAPRRAASVGVWPALLAVVVAGIGLRVELLPRLGNVPDTVTFYEWANVLATRSVADVYRDPALLVRAPVNYPPVYLDLLSLLPGLHDACCDGAVWSDPTIAHGLRREALRLVFWDVADRVREARAGDTAIGEKLTAGTQSDMEWAGLGREFHAAGVRTYAELAGFDQRYLLGGSHLVAGHRAVLTLLKLPATLADMALAVLLLAAAWRWAGRWPAVLAAAALFLNPLVIHESAYWGQLDSIPTALIVACLLALVARRWWLVFPLLVMALLTKLQTVIVVPVVAAVVLATVARRQPEDHQGVHGELKRVASGLAIGGATAAAILLPIVRGGALRALAGVYTGLLGQYPFLTAHAFNAWWLFTDGDPVASFVASPRDNVTTVLGVTPKTIGFVLFAAVVGLVIAAIVRRRGDRSSVVLGALAVAMGFFCLPTEIHERYGYPIVPLAILAAVAVGRKYWWVAGAASLTHSANLVLGGLADRPGGPPTTGIEAALATTPELTYAIAVANLVLLVIVAVDIYRLASGAASGAAGSPTPVVHGVWR
jgi:hypothetical protein